MNSISTSEKIAQTSKNIDLTSVKFFYLEEAVLNFGEDRSNFEEPVLNFGEPVPNFKEPPPNLEEVYTGNLTAQISQSRESQFYQIHHQVF